MANKHLYLGIENVNLNATQRNTLIAALRALGVHGTPRNEHNNHDRIRLDGDAGIFETLFDEDTLTIDAFKARLGTILGVDPATIDHSGATGNWGGQSTPVVTFSRGGTDYVRMALFGGTGATWEQSRQAALAYIAANLSEWESVEE